MNKRKGGDFGSLRGAYASVFHWLCLLKLLIADYYSRPGDTPWPNSRIRGIKGIHIHNFCLHCHFWFLPQQWPEQQGPAIGSFADAVEKQLLTTIVNYLSCYINLIISILIIYCHLICPRDPESDKWKKQDGWMDFFISIYARILCSIIILHFLSTFL